MLLKIHMAFTQSPLYILKVSFSGAYQHLKRLKSSQTDQVVLDRTRQENYEKNNVLI